MPSYLSIGHVVDDHRKTELWWWDGKTPSRLNRVCPTCPFEWKAVYNQQPTRFTHGNENIVQNREAYEFNEKYAQGRVDHKDFVVSYVPPALPCHRRVVEHLLKKSFPGYTIVEF